MSLKKWTHDFNFVFSVTVDESDPDDIPEELIVERLLETIHNMSCREMFERSECFNSFEEEIGD